MFQLLNAETIEHRENSAILFHGIKTHPKPTPRLRHNIQAEWLQKHGELILTNKRLLFFTYQHSLFGKKVISLEFSFLRKGISATISRRKMGAPTIEINTGVDQIRFSVANPEVWERMLTSQ